MAKKQIIKIGVTIQFRKEILDTEGRALLKLLQNKDSSIKECHYGKYIVLHLEENDSQKALEVARKMSQNILSNELIEKFELKIIED